MVDWTEDSYLVGGLSTGCCFCAPRAYIHEDTFKLILCKDYSIKAYYWGGSSWIEDSSIITGLSGAGVKTVPAIFFNGTTLTMIAGEFSGIFKGWYWNGSTWVSDSDLVDGLVDVGTSSTPTVFLDGSTLKLITGMASGNFTGYYWNGSTWIPDSSIINGLTRVSNFSAPSVYRNNKLITGKENGLFAGWYWNGSTWISDSDLVTGLTSKGNYSSPTIFEDGSSLVLISGTNMGLSHGWYKSAEKIEVGDTVLLIPNYGDTYDRAAIKGSDISTGNNVQLYPLKGGAKVAIKESWLSGDSIIF